MTTKTKAARNSCNYAAPDTFHAWSETQNSITDFERGAFIAGIFIVLTFGFIFVHAAVML